MRIMVETREHCGRAVPCKLRLREREVNVVELIDQWFGSDYRYCKVRGNDDATYILRVADPHSDWQLAFFSIPRAPTAVRPHEWNRPHRTRM
jgi:hypothetical protein